MSEIHYHQEAFAESVEKKRFADLLQEVKALKRAQPWWREKPPRWVRNEARFADTREAMVCVLERYKHFLLTGRKP